MKDTQTYRVRNYLGEIKVYTQEELDAKILSNLKYLCGAADQLNTNDIIAWDTVTFYDILEHHIEEVESLCSRVVS